MNKRQFKRISLIVSLIITSIALSSYSLKNVLVAATPAAAAQLLKIGVIGPYDGATAQGILLATERINVKGPISTSDGNSYTLTVEAADAATPADVNTAIATLKQHGAVAIFGPDDDTLAEKSQAALSAAGIPVFTGTSSTTFQPGDLIFRTRANYNWIMADLATVLTTDLTRKNIAIYQGGADYEGRAGAFSKALQALNVTSVGIIQAPADAKMDAMAAQLMGKQPDAIVAFAPITQTADLYRTLRGSNFGGIYVTLNTDDRDFIRSLPTSLRSGLYGATTWPYSWNTPDSDQFTRDYVALFGEAPNSYSAAAYDSAIALIIAIEQGGVSPAAIKTKLLGLPKANSIQGLFNPQIGGNEFSQNVAIISTGPYGGPQLIARFNAAQRQPLSETAPTATLRPTNTPTGTPAGNVIVAKATVNIRSGPGTVYPVIGKLKKGDQVTIVGANNDLSWFVIDYRGTQGWVSSGADLVDVFGDVKSLPIIAAPPTPTAQPSPTITFTPSPQPKADIILVGQPTLNPAVPQPGQPFTLTAILQNQGGANAGPFAVATTFEPGNVFASVNLTGLAAGAQTTITLNATVPSTTISTVAIVIDLNNQLDEGPDGKANDKPTFTYRVDKPFVANSSITLTTGATVDLFGGTADISWDGIKLMPKNGAKLGELDGVKQEQIYWDFLDATKINNTTGIASANLVQGLVVGIYTAEGNRGFLVISSNSGGTLVLNYYIYAA